MMKRTRMRFLGAIACGAALVAVAALALPASGTAPPGSAFFAKLDGSHEPAGPGVNDPDGYGTFSGIFNGTKLCYGLQVARIDTPAAAHIHQAPIGSSGPIKVTLNKPASGAAGASAGCVTLTTTLANAIKSNPRGFYVNVHTGTFSNGAIRGQLFQATATQDK